MKIKKTLFTLAFFLIVLVDSLIAGDTLNYESGRNYQLKSGFTKHDNLTDTIFKSATITDSELNEKNIHKNKISASMERPYIIKISFQGTHKNIQVSLYDMLGKQVQKFTPVNSSDYSWTINNNLKGLYLLKIKSENAFLVKKIIL